MGLTRMTDEELDTIDQAPSAREAVLIEELRAERERCEKAEAEVERLRSAWTAPGDDKQR